MNCFMGYNPLVAKEVKITTWIKEFDGDSPVYPSFPNEGDCFVVFATDEDALTHNALSKKTYTNGEWADAIPSGTIEITENGEGIDVSEYAYADVNVSGGVAFPTFTQSGESWSCNMTYAEAKTYWATYNLNTICPCQKVSISSSWVNMTVADDTMLPSLEDIFDFDDDVTEAVVVLSIEGQSTTFYVAYGNNGKLYNINA